VSVVAIDGTNRGRPTIVTDAVVAKLEYGFMKGLNVTECCHYADISRNCFYEYLEKNPDFKDRIEELRSNPSTKAKLNVVEVIENGDTDLSKWWLERRNKDEFTTKQEIDADVKEKVNITIELSDD
jgi:ACT domain-containing protein